jgi:probable HAF family extracellular repeat protein
VNGARDLGNLPDGSEAHAFAVSADGSRVAGGDSTSIGAEAFIWDSVNGMQGLGVLPGGESEPSSVAHGISADGSIVVGGSSSSFGNEAFIWDAANGMKGLGDLPNYFGNFSSYATDVSADGSIVVGFGLSNDGFTPFVWDVVSGMRQLDVLLTTMGVDLDGWTLSSWEVWPHDFPRISADGRTIIGSAVYFGQPTGFVAVIPEPSTALLVGLGLAGLVLPGTRLRHPSAP